MSEILLVVPRSVTVTPSSSTESMPTMSLDRLIRCQLVTVCRYVHVPLWVEICLMTETASRWIVSLQCFCYHRKGSNRHYDPSAQCSICCCRCIMSLVWHEANGIVPRQIWLTFSSGRHPCSVFLDRECTSSIIVSDSIMYGRSDTLDRTIR